MPHDTTLTAIKRNIVKRHCRVIAVIDDKVFETDNPRSISTIYHEFRGKCESEGVLCHLHHFPNTSHETDSYEVTMQRKLALTLAERADAIVLDWFLGMDTSPEHAVYLLDCLKKTEAVRFIVIYTAAPAQEVKSVLTSLHFQQLEQASITPEQEFIGVDEEGDLDLVSGSDVAQNAVEATVYNFHFDNRLFISVRTKAAHTSQDTNSSTNRDPTELINEVYNVFLTAFPDLLHWAGLELATRTGDLLPKVVAAMPSGTDGALLVQLLYQRKDEVAEQVVEILLDELRSSLYAKPLSVVCDDVLFPYLKERMVEFCKGSDEFKTITRALDKKHVEALPKAQEKIDAAQEKGRDPQLGKDEKEAQARYTNITTRWSDAELDVLRLLLQTDDPTLANYFPYIKSACLINEAKQEDDSKGAAVDTCTSITSYVEQSAHEAVLLQRNVAWATARESVFLFQSHRRLMTGTVLQRQADDADKPEWLLCITPGCDCYRPTGKGLLFLAGRTRHIGEALQSRLHETQTCVKNKEIIWNAAHHIVEKSYSTIEALEAAALAGEYIIDGAKYGLAGALREAFTMRIVQRNWSYQSRVAVDTSEFLRGRRNER